MKNKILKIVIIISIIVIIIDQGTKLIITKFDGFGNEAFGIVVTENTGMAFGFNDGNVKNIVLTIFVLGLLISFLKNQKEQLDTKTTIAISLAVGGGFSNLIDRFFRGGVLDFISILKFPKFNVADICICTAWILIVIFLIFYSSKKDTKNTSITEELEKDNKEEKK